MTSSDLIALVVQREDDARDLKDAVVWRLRSMVDPATLDHRWMVRSVKFLQRATPAESVFRLLVDRTRAVGEGLVRFVGRSLRVGGVQPRLDLDRLGHPVGDNTGCIPLVEGHARRGRYGLTRARGIFAALEGTCEHAGYAIESPD